MTSRKAESFMRGALMLSLAALVSRLLGALYKPMIAGIFAPFDGHNGVTGIGLTQVPQSTYQVILSFTSVGLNVGISKLVAEHMAFGDVTGAKRVFRVSLGLMAVLGLVASLVMFVGAPWIAAAIGKEAVETIPGFRATAPALLVVSIMAAYRGLFQGFQQMTPSANSQIVEQFVRVGAGITLTYVFVQKGVAFGAAGFNFGDVVGALAALLYLLWMVRRTGQDLWASPAAASEAGVVRHSVRREKLWPLVRRIFSIAAPIAISGAVVPLMMAADTFFVYRALSPSGMSADDITAQYGLLTNAFMIAWLPSILTQAIYTSVLPAITQAVALGQREQARRRAQQAYRITMLIAVPAQVGLYVLAPGVYYLLFRDFTGASVMAAISWAVVPTMLQQTTSGILQGAGRVTLPVRNFLIGAAVKAILTAWWTGMWGINGAAYATAVGFLLAAGLNLIYVEKLLGRTLKTRGMVLKPILAALVMAGVIAAVRIPLRATVHSVRLDTFVLVGVGGFAYGLALLLVRGIRRPELEFVPKVGPRLADLLERLHLLR